MSLRDEGINQAQNMTLRSTDYHYAVEHGPIGIDSYSQRKVRVTDVTVTEFANSERADVRLHGHMVNRDGSRDRRNSSGDTLFDTELQERFYAAHLFASGQQS